MGFTSIDNFVSEVTSGKFWRADYNKLYAGGTAIAGNWYDLTQGNGTPAQYLHGNYLQNYDFVTNMAPWTIGTANWAYTAATHLMTRTANADVSTLSQNTKCVNGIAYMVTYALGWTAGTFTISLGGTNGTSRGSAATFREIIVCGATANAPLVITPNATGAGTVDLVSVQPLAGNFVPYNDAIEGALWHGGDVAPDTKHLVNFGGWTNAATGVPSVLMLVDVLGCYPRVQTDSAAYQILSGSDSFTRAVMLDGQTALNEQSPANVVNSVVVKVTEGVTGGSANTSCAKIAVATAFTTGIIASKVVALASTSFNYTYAKYVYMWVRSSLALNAGDVTFCTDEHGSLASSYDVPLPALAQDTWTRVRIDVSAGTVTDKDTVISIGFKVINDKAAFNLYVDDLRWAMPDGMLFNGTFTGNATGWTLGANWAYRSNDIERTANAGITTAEQANLPVAQKCPYRITYDIANRSAGSVTVSLGGTAGTSRTTDGTYEEVIVCGITNFTLAFTPDAAFNGRIDNIICTPMIPRADETTATFGGGVRMLYVMDNALSNGANASTVQIVYTNQAGTEGRNIGATVNMMASDVVAHIPHSGVGAGKYGPFIPLQGDYGIRSVDALKFSAAQATALAAVDVLVVKVIASIPLTTAFVAAERDLMNQLPSLPRVRDGACLMFLHGAGAVTASGTSFAGYTDFAWS